MRLPVHRGMPLYPYTSVMFFVRSRRRHDPPLHRSSSRSPSPHRHDERRATAADRFAGGRDRKIFASAKIPDPPVARSEHGGTLAAFGPENIPAHAGSILHPCGAIIHLSWSYVIFNLIWIIWFCFGLPDVYLFHKYSGEGVSPLSIPRPCRARRRTADATAAEGAR